MRVPIGRTSNIESTNWQLADTDVASLKGLNFVRVPIGRTSNIEFTNWQLADIHKIILCHFYSSINV